ACRYVGFPLVVKPVGGNHGRGITVNIQNLEDAVIAFHAAKNVSPKVIIEKYITGEDYRLLVINNVLVAAAKRSPAHIIGDGKSAIKELVDEVNRDPRRGYGHENVLTKITINDLSKTIIAANGYTEESVPNQRERVILIDAGNLSTG